MDCEVNQNDNGTELFE